MENQTQTTLETQRLPLWKAVLDEILAEGIEFGKIYPTHWLVAKLDCPKESMEFGTSIRAINDHLATLGGYYLSERGQCGKQFVIVQPEASERVGDNYVKCSLREMSRALVMFDGLRHNEKAGLSDNDKLRLESKSVKTAMRLAMMRAPKSFASIRKQKAIE